MGQSSRVRQNKVNAAAYIGAGIVTPGAGGGGPAAFTTIFSDRRVYGITDAATLSASGGAGATAAVPVAGTLTGPPSAIQVRSVDFTTGAEVTPWATVAANPSGGTWSGTFQMREYKGWQKLEVRAGTTGPASAVTDKKIGAGLLIGLEGQSQARYFAVNVSSGGLVTAEDLVSVYGSDGILEAASGGHGSDSNFGSADWYNAAASLTKNGNPILGGGGAGAAACGNQLVSSLNVPVGFIVNAPGGRSMAEINSASHKPFILQRYAEVGRPNFIIMLSHGGADVGLGTTDVAYLALLNEWKAWHDGDAFASPRSKYLMVPLMQQLPTSNFPSNVRRGQQRFVAENSPAVAYCASMYDCLLQPDGIHQSDVGNAVVGRRVAVSVLRELGVAGVVGSRGPSLVSATRAGAVLTANVSFADGATALTTSGTGSPVSGSTGFSAVKESDGTVLTVSSVAVNATTITATLSADPGGPVRLRWGSSHNPGPTCIVDNGPAPGQARGGPLRFELLGVLTPS